MTTLVKVGKELKEIDLLSIFRPVEGEITLRYGRIGQGKTYGATMDVLDDLSRGKVVYINWHMNYNGIDQRKHWVFILGGLLFPWKKQYFVFPKDNLKYIKVDENFIDTFSKLTDCAVYLDEGHVMFDSYEMAKMNMNKRTAVLHTRHFDRSINIISQRPTAIHVTMRANVNRFYRYDKLFSFPFLLFRRTEFQDITNETVNEELPLCTKVYLGKKEIYNMYDSKYLRGDLQSSQTVQFSLFHANYLDKIGFLLAKLRARWFTSSAK